MPIDYSSVKPLEDAANTATSTAMTATASANTLPDKLRQAVSERFINSPIQQQRNTAVESFLSSPDKAREFVADKVNNGSILSPTQQASIMSARRASDVIPLVSLNDLLKAQFGGMQDVVGAGTNAYKQQVDTLQGNAKLAQDRYTAGLNKLYKDEDFRLQEERNATEKSKSGGGGDIMKSLLALMTGGKGGAGGGGIPTEAKPTGIPSDGMQERVTGKIHSSDGQWIFNRAMQQWQPAELPEGTYQVGTKAVDDSTGVTWEMTPNGWNSTGGGQASGGNSLTDVLSTPEGKNILTMGVLSGQIPASAISGLQGTGALTKPATSGQQQSAVMANTAIGSVQRLMDLLDKNPNVSKSSTVPLLNRFGDAAAYNNSKNAALRQLLNLYSGKVVSDSEYQRYTSSLSDPTLSPEEIQRNLVDYYTTLQGIRDLGQLK